MGREEVMWGERRRSAEGGGGVGREEVVWGGRRRCGEGGEGRVRSLSCIAAIGR